MALEYPMKMILFVAVVAILIGIMWYFRDRIIKLCIFPPCDETPKCEVKTAFVTENEITVDVIEKYCRLCWDKNRKGKCGEDAVCYVISAENPGIPPDQSKLSPEVSEYCFIFCNRKATSISVQYIWLDKRIKISC